MSRRPPKCRYRLLIAGKKTEYILLDDIGHANHRTITNDVDDLVPHLVDIGELQKTQRLYYYDSDHILTEILHDGESFLGFHFPQDHEAAHIPRRKKR